MKWSSVACVVIAGIVIICVAGMQFAGNEYKNCPTNRKGLITKEQIPEIVNDYYNSHPQEFMSLINRAVQFNSNKDMLNKIKTALPGVRALELPVIGDSAAQEMFMFFDFSCIYCKKMISNLLTNYVDTKKVKIKLIPVSILGAASKSRLLLALYAVKQGKDYREIVTKLLDISSDKSKFLQDMSLQDSDFERWSTSDDAKKLSDNILDLFQSSGANGTPHTFMVRKDGSIYYVPGYTDKLDIR